MQENEVNYIYPRKRFWWIVLIYLTYCSNCDAFDNTTEQLQNMDDEYLMKGRFLKIKGKKPKFLTFNTYDEEISVEMQLGIPFLTIPVKKTMNSATGIFNSIPTVNINAGAIVMAAGITLGAIYVTPFIGKIADKFPLKPAPTQRRIEEEESFVDSVMKILDDQGVPAQDCLQRAVCTLIRRSTENQNPSSSDKIVDGISSNVWLMNQLEGTAISEAIETGRSKAECTTKYSRCKINPNVLQTLSKQYFNNIFNNNI